MLNDIKTEAAKLFSEMGADFTLEQLQVRTGISRATLYRRIGSKEALLDQISREGLITLGSRANIASRVFAATRKVVADHGFVASTMEQIAQEAGLGVATLYRHFNDKENLFKRFIEQLNPKLAFKSIFDHDGDDLEEDIRQVIHVALRFLCDNQDMVKILYSWQRAERAYVAHIREGSTTNFAEMRNYFALQQARGNLRHDVSAKDLALNLNGLLMQYAVYAPIHHERPLDIPRDAETILKTFLNGASAPI